MYKPRIIQGQDHPTYLEKWKLKLVQCHAQLEQEIGNLYEGIFGQMFKQLSPVAVAVSDPKSEASEATSAGRVNLESSRIQEVKKRVREKTSARRANLESSRTPKVKKRVREAASASRVSLKSFRPQEVKQRNETCCQIRFIRGTDMVTFCVSKNQILA